MTLTLDMIEAWEVLWDMALDAGWWPRCQWDDRGRRRVHIGQFGWAPCAHLAGCPPLWVWARNNAPDLLRDACVTSHGASLQRDYQAIVYSVVQRGGAPDRDTLCRCWQARHRPSPPVGGPMPAYLAHLSGGWSGSMDKSEPLLRARRDVLPLLGWSKVLSRWTAPSAGPAGPGSRAG